MQTKKIPDAKMMESIVNDNIDKAFNDDVYSHKVTITNLLLTHHQKNKKYIFYKFNYINYKEDKNRNYVNKIANELKSQLIEKGYDAAYMFDSTGYMFQLYVSWCKKYPNLATKLVETNGTFLASVRY